MTAEKKDRKPLRIKNLADLKRHIKLGTELVAMAHQCLTPTSRIWERPRRKARTLL